MKALYKYITEGYSGAGLIITFEDEVLFQLRKYPRSWAFIGGGFDKTKDKDFLDTAIREVFEESGIKINKEDVDKKAIHKLGFGRYKWVLYHASLSKRPTINGKKEFSNEYIKYKWVKINNYRFQLNEKEKKHYRLYFFVSYQMKELQKRITSF